MKIMLTAPQQGNTTHILQFMIRTHGLFVFKYAEHGGSGDIGNEFVALCI